jgi:predicted lipid-binding transport protein (Tim44 family)
MFRATTALLLVLALALLPACQMNERMSGAAFGAGGGALLGGLVSGNAVGVVLGGIAGGVAGYVVGDYLADRRERGLSPCYQPPAQPQPCAPQPCAPQPYATQPYAPQPYTPQAYAPPASPSAAHGAPRVGGVSAVDPNRAAADAWVVRGRRALTADRAGAAYREALRLDPDHAEAWYLLGLQAEAAGRRPEARQALAQALECDPSHARARRALSELGR